MTSTIVFGAGYLGTRIAEELGFVLTDTNPLNESTLEKFLNENNPSIIVNAIGKTGRPNIDWCESHKEETLRSNVTAAIALGSTASKRGIYFVHLGSGCIYEGDNNKKGFTEEDEPNFYGPQFYAKTKILAEKALKELPTSLILRIRMPLDNFSHDRNLINKLSHYPKVIDVQNSITTVPHAISAMKKLIDQRATGIYNFVNPSTVSAYEIMEMYQEIVGKNYIFQKMSLGELNSLTKGIRSNCYLNTDKLNRAGIFLPDAKEAVRECLVQYRESLQ